MAISYGDNLNSVPAPVQQTLTSNYIDFTSADTKGWAQQFLPDLMNAEAEVFGNRSVSGFLQQVGAEEPMSSDQIIWSEQGRLHLSYEGDVAGTASNGQITITHDIDGNEQTTTHGIRVGDTVVVSSAALTVKCYVTVAAAASATFTCIPYSAATLATAGFGNTDPVNIFVYGSEFAKGTTGQGSSSTDNKSIKPSFQSFTNKPIIIKDYYEISGSDAAQIGWVEVSGEAGQAGYMWYLKAEGDTRVRYADKLEMTLVEAEMAAAASTVENSLGLSASTTGKDAGTEGLFAAITDRGNLTDGIDGTSAAQDFNEFDAILAEFDKQGAIEENMMFLNRGTSLAIDDMLASLNGGYNAGTSYGVFQNSEAMALNLGFMGFRRGSYDFYKTDWKYLNDKSTRGGILDTVNKVRGIIVPAGVSSVYDQMMGRNMMRPFLHVRYRASQMEDRYMKTWITGSVGAVTSDLDAMGVNYLSERCLVVQGANNFFMFKG